MKKITLSLTFAFVLRCSISSNAQNDDYKWAFTYQAGIFQYVGDYGNEMFDFTPFRLFQRFGISRYINPNFDVEFIGKWGHRGYRDDEHDKNLFHLGLKGLDGLISYKFLGGNAFRPYVKA